MNDLIDRPPEAKPAVVPISVPIKSAIVLALSGYLLLAHGCHGDEDTELFTGARHMPALSQPGEAP